MHANMMAYTATYMATCKPWMNSLSDSETVEEICHTSKLVHIQQCNIVSIILALILCWQVKELAKQTLCASSLVFTNQSDQVKSHKKAFFNLILCDRILDHFTCMCRKRREAFRL